MQVKLYVGNLSYATTEQNLRELFMRAGDVAFVALLKESGTRRSKGFVEMSTQSGMQKAISLFNGYTLDQHQLTVKVVRPREKHADLHQKGSGSRRGYV